MPLGDLMGFTSAIVVGMIVRKLVAALNRHQ
jgi:hypothetical protein